jgi:DNA polymerase III delta subunit
MSETDFAQLAGLHPFVARKALSQARGLEMDALVRAHLAVVEADAAVKSGRMEDVVALDALIATLCAG